MTANWEVDALLADLQLARGDLEAADRRARTYLVHRGVLDQTTRDVSSLLRAAADARDPSSTQEYSRRRTRYKQYEANDEIPLYRAIFARMRPQFP